MTNLLAIKKEGKWEIAIVKDNVYDGVRISDFTNEIAAIVLDVIGTQVPNRTMVKIEIGVEKPVVSNG